MKGSEGTPPYVPSRLCAQVQVVFTCHFHNEGWTEDVGPIECVKELHGS
jgi:hypothetical protein